MQPIGSDPIHIIVKNGRMEKLGRRSHRFRDTFAISLLLRGAELPNVSILLGHSSIRVTERHYSPWVKARQEQLEADVRRTWKPQANAPKRSRSSRRTTAS
jgi:integrase